MANSYEEILAESILGKGVLSVGPGDHAIQFFKMLLLLYNAVCLTYNINIKNITYLLHFIN